LIEAGQKADSFRPCLDLLRFIKIWFTKTVSRKCFLKNGEGDVWREIFINYNLDIFLPIEQDTR
jgi:hypothetical protein